MLRHSRWLTLGLLAVLVVMAMGGFLISAEAFGYPLDDAWIHQTYARNLAQTGRWEFVPGVASSGSTAPLYTGLLALGYALRLPHPVWTTLLGGVLLLWVGWMTLRLWQQLWPSQADKGWWLGVATVLLWPLVWAAVSGMETLLFTALALTILSRTLSRPRSPFALTFLGALIGLLILTRPDGGLLALLVAAALALQSATWSQRIKRVALVAISAVVMLLPYFWFNWQTSATLWPNTLYAKQLEYAVLRTQPWLGRVLHHLWFSVGGAETGWRGISGAQLLLLPGIFVAGWRALRRDSAERQLAATLPLLWAVAHVIVYALRLPVTYQHGRYLMPVLPIWLLYGAAGWLFLLRGGGRWQWSVSRVLGGTFVALLLIFYGLGARAYAADVALVEHEMVAAARWIAANTPPDATVAAHDVGALGYFAPRPLVDLGGLTDSTVSEHFGTSAETDLIWSADFLMTAPGWSYPAVTGDPRAVERFSSGYIPTQDAGLNNVKIYALR